MRISFFCCKLLFKGNKIKWNKRKHNDGVNMSGMVNDVMQKMVTETFDEKDMV